MVTPLDETALTSLPMTGGRIEARFDDRDDVVRAWKLLESQSLFMRTRAAAPAYAELTLVLSLPDDTICPDIPVRLVQALPFGEEPGIVFQLMKTPPELYGTLRTYLQATKRKRPHSGIQSGVYSMPSGIRERPSGIHQQASGVHQQPSGIHEQSPESHGGRAEDRMTLHERLRRMRPDERARHATRANKVERAIMMRDTEPSVLLFLLRNPNLTRAEVIEMTKLKTLNHQIITKILSNKVWAQIEELRYNLAVNPKTPLPISMKILPSLNAKHVREMAKNQSLRAQLKQAALRLVLKNAES